jgi:mannose-6-phosphate isomerase-like protein (cupin superfamily)
MTQQDRQADARVRILRVADHAAWGSFFASEMAGNRVANVGIADLGCGRLQVAWAETDGGASFPAQYHSGGGVEIAVIIAGAGAIEVEEDETNREVYAFTAGDVVLIPPQLVYRVRNRRGSEPLLAWVFFAVDKEFYWPDGRRA